MHHYHYNDEAVAILAPQPHGVVKMKLVASAVHAGSHCTVACQAVHSLHFGSRSGTLHQVCEQASGCSSCLQSAEFGLHTHGDRALLLWGTCYKATCSARATCLAVHGGAVWLTGGHDAVVQLALLWSLLALTVPVPEKAGGY